MSDFVSFLVNALLFFRFPEMWGSFRGSSAIFVFCWLFQSSRPALHYIMLYNFKGCPQKQMSVEWKFLRGVKRLES